MLYKTIDGTIGNTPLVELTNIEKDLKLDARIYGKIEAFNPAGSVKDRIAKEMIDDLEERGILKEDSVIIEPTSGNTGIALSSIATARGYRAIIVMPETMSIERRKLIKAYGAKLVLTEGAKGMKGAVAKAEELSKTILNAVIPGQFINPANPATHYRTTGPEIYRDLDGKVDIFVAGVGTGGTLSGVGKYLREKNPYVEIIAVEPKGSPLLSEGRTGTHKIQGIGAGFIPETFDRDIYNRVIAVGDEDAFKAGRFVGKKEGILVGISSGATTWAAIELAKDSANKGKNIVAIMADTGERYLSTALFEE